MNRYSAELRVTDFDFHLPTELIAQQPPAMRGASRMLRLNRTTGALADSSFAQLPEALEPGTLLVLNDTRVIPARLFARRMTVREKEPATGAIEVLLTTPVAAPAGVQRWKALVRPGKKVQVEDKLAFFDAEEKVALEATVLERGEFGERVLEISAPDGDFFAALDRIGHMPLPPYIHREDILSDRERYQTVFSRERGSVAAPTAGLHFTPEILAAIEARGVQIAKLTLHVGLGTFAPLRVEKVNEVHLHRERYTLSEATAAALNLAKMEGRKIVAVGTTVVRTLEHCAEVAAGKPLEAHSGETEIFIAPGFEFKLVQGMVTNFHLPQSSLLMLVSAFAGREPVLAAYNHAVAEKYRFFSYGDCMLIQ